MMSDLLELAVDAKCLSYLERLLRSGKSLSHLLWESVDFAAGKIHILLSKQVSGHEIRDFALGGIGSIKPARSTLAEIAIRYLQEPGKQIVLEEGLARAGDPAVRNKTGVLFLGDEIYYAAEKIDNPEQMERFLMQPRYSLGLVGIFSAVAPGQVSKISQTQLARLVEVTEKIVVGAFDGEGYLLWTKKK